MNISFERVGPKYIDIIMSWLSEPHMIEFWDNGQDHKDDIVNFAHGRKELSNYWGGMFDYWIGFKDGQPYSLIMTHEENEASDPPECFKPYLSKTGKSIGLDFGIGNPDFVGQGLAAPTLIAFMDYFSSQVDLAADTYIIDPNTNNPRAIHVYEKAGFQIMCEFIPDEGYFAGSPGVVMVKRYS
jgi:RimJ/RimL family protein N-acetyltransferase